MLIESSTGILTLDPRLLPLLIWFLEHASSPLKRRYLDCPSMRLQHANAKMWEVEFANFESVDKTLSSRDRFQKNIKTFSDALDGVSRRKQATLGYRCRWRLAPSTMRFPLRNSGSDERNSGSPVWARVNIKAYMLTLLVRERQKDREPERAPERFDLFDMTSCSAYRSRHSGSL